MIDKFKLLAVVRHPSNNIHDDLQPYMHLLEVAANLADPPTHEPTRMIVTSHSTVLSAPSKKAALGRRINKVEMKCPACGIYLPWKESTAEQFDRVCTGIRQERREREGVAKHHDPIT